MPAHWYSFSAELNPYWKTIYVDQPSIRAYWKSIFDKYSLADHTVFNSAVGKATWDVAQQLYHVEVKDLASGKIRTVEAEVLIWAIGGFVNPNIPADLRGQFKGEVFHSARWNHDVSLSNKRVGVIGNGCSA